MTRSQMHILFAGATGVLGRATLPHLDGHDVVGLTRTRAELEALRALGAYGVVCDVYDYERLLRVAEETKPQVVGNFLSTTPSMSTRQVPRRQSSSRPLHLEPTSSRRRTSLTRRCDEARAVSGLPFSVLGRRCSGDDNPRDLA